VKVASSEFILRRIRKQRGMDFSTPSCKLKRLASHTYVSVEKDPARPFGAGDAVVEVHARDIPPNTEHPFSIFSIVPDGTGRAWQLRYGDTELVLGMLPHEGGRAGLVPRTEHDEPTPGTQVFIRRATNRLENVYIENSAGTLYMDTSAGSFFWGATTLIEAAIFQFHRILSMLDTAPVDPLKFVRIPDQPMLLTLPPLGVDAEDYEAEHFPASPPPPRHPPPLNANAASESVQSVSSVRERPPGPTQPPPPRIHDTSSFDVAYLLMLAGVTTLGFVVGAAWVRKRRRRHL